MEELKCEVLQHLWFCRIRLTGNLTNQKQKQKRCDGLGEMKKSGEENLPDYFAAIENLFCIQMALNKQVIGRALFQFINSKDRYFNIFFHFWNEQFTHRELPTHYTGFNIDVFQNLKTFEGT